jgi:hypothetical protein
MIKMLYEMPQVWLQLERPGTGQRREDVPSHTDAGTGSGNG